MKLLVIGDFHGKFPVKLKREAKKVDLVVSVGDYLPFHYRKLWFKHCYGKDVDLDEIIGKRKYNQLIKEDLRRGEKVLKELNKLKVPVFTVLGNIDYPQVDDSSDEESITKRIGKKYWKEGEERKNDVIKLLKKYKNIKRFDYSFFKFGGFVFIGARGHSFPGSVKSKGYKKYRKKLDNLFKRFKKEKIIFITHLMPQGKLDKITSKDADKKVKGEHYGSKMFKRIINKYQPLLFAGGHFHENQGRAKLGKTIVLNTGGAYENKGIVVDIDEEKGKVKNVKFLK